MSDPLLPYPNDELVLLATRDQTRGTTKLDAQSPNEPGTLPLPLEVAADPVLTPCKCAKPAIQTMDYKKHSPDDWDNPEPRINRCCLKCWAHWFGPPDAVLFYTSKQWDELVSSPPTSTPSQT